MTVTATIWELKGKWMGLPYQQLPSCWVFAMSGRQAKLVLKSLSYFTAMLSR